MLENYVFWSNRSGCKILFEKFVEEKISAENFYKEFQTGTLITSFSDTHFQSLVAVLLVKFIKVQKFWVGRVWLSQELFYYKYPFYLPNLFQPKFNKYKYEVRVHLFKTFSSEGIEKVFIIKEFLQNYTSCLSNQQKTKIKEYFIQSIKLFHQYDLIENNYKILFYNKNLKWQRLKTQSHFSKKGFGIN